MFSKTASLCSAASSSRTLACKRYFRSRDVPCESEAAMSRRLDTALFTFWVIIGGAVSPCCSKGGRDIGSSVPGRENGNDAAAGGAASVAYSSVGDPNVWFATFTGEMEKEAKKRGYRFTVVDAQAKIDKQLADV